MRFRKFAWFSFIWKNGARTGLWFINLQKEGLGLETLQGPFQLQWINPLPLNSISKMDLNSLEVCTCFFAGF